ncbi:glucosaminidase domain-containing protein [Chitinophaga defluvii]|uniref:Glucosaminidase domain-containing protein n=1 Tax=Chitinophaga defluvii TaxID=3163343 RepID=A0ABV2T6D4_9BACT
MRYFKQLKGRVWLCAIFILLSNVVSAQHSTKSYIKKYTPVSQEIMEETGIPASVILGVAMLESGAGNSKNTKLLRNHFGIVGKNNLAKRKAGYRSSYKEYATDLDSYKHFARLLASKKWFSKVQGKPDFATWLKHMNHGGYSSAGQVWIKRVTAIINRHKLYQLDTKMDVDVAKQP